MPMIDEQNTKKWLTLTQAADLLPRRRRGRKVAASTLYRWARYGLRGIRLQVWQVGSGLCTTEAPLDEFVAALMAARGLASSRRHAPVEDAAVHTRLVARGLIDPTRDPQ